jgi:AcrR family transcriptional regulator
MTNADAGETGTFAAPRPRKRSPQATPEERTAERKRDLIAVAGRLFAERGFHGTSMADIAAQFGVRKATLYHWVDSKESLLAQVLADVVGDAADEMRLVVSLELPATERLRMLVRIHLDSWAANPHNMEVGITEARWLEGAARERYLESMQIIGDAYRQVFRQGLESGEFSFKPTELTLVMNSVLGMVQWFPRWYDSDGWAGPDYIANLMADVALRGLLPRRRD